MLYYKERAPYFIASHYVNLKNRPKKVENTPFFHAQDLKNYTYMI